MTIARVRALHAALGIEGLDDLQQAAVAGKLRELKGFGAKTEQKILEGIDRYRNRPARLRLIDARDIALPLAQRLRGRPRGGGAGDRRAPFAAGRRRSARCGWWPRPPSQNRRWRR